MIISLISLVILLFVLVLQGYFLFKLREQWIVEQTQRSETKQQWHENWFQLMQFYHEQQQKLEEFQSKLQTFQLQLKNQVLETILESKLQQQRVLNEFKESLLHGFSEMRGQFDRRQLESLQTMQESFRANMQDTRQQIVTFLSQHSEQISKRVDKLTEENNSRLSEISIQVEKRLSEGFEKTTATFSDVLKRLALIDEAQKRITELSSNVVSLQEVLSDKQSRGTFGEVQLSALIRNVLPESSFRLQHTLSNNKRADCILFLPEPTGHIIIDAKFPLDAYRKLNNKDSSDADKRQAEQQFRHDIRRHIQDISEKYILSGETADGAVMFIPAEAVFAEIHARYPELVEEGHKKRVWMASPTTMMAILTTARAVLKDADTRKQVHVIQEHLSYLAKDFQRFHKRMDNLAKHIQQAHEDVKDVHTSAKKITSRFQKIEQVEIEENQTVALEYLDTDMESES